MSASAIKSSRSQGMQTELPMANASVVESKVYFRIVYGDKVLQFKLGWQSPLQVLFCKLDIRADFVWHGVILDETLSPQHYNMLPGEENTVTVHVMRSDTRTTTHQEDMIINDAIRAMGLKLRLQEEKTAVLQNENDELQGQMYALHREISDLNNAASQMLEEERAKTHVTNAENTRLLNEMDELRVQLESARAQLASKEATSAGTAAATVGAGGRRQGSLSSSARSSPAPSRAGVGVGARGAAKQSIAAQSAARQGTALRSTTPRGVGAKNLANSAAPVTHGTSTRETQIAVLRNELSAWQCGVQQSAKAPVASQQRPAASMQQQQQQQQEHYTALPHQAPPSESWHGAQTSSPGRGASAFGPSASPPPATPSEHQHHHQHPADMMAQQPHTEGSGDLGGGAPLETKIKCILLNEQSGVQKKLPPLKGPPESTVTVAEALEMLRERHGGLIPPMTALMACVQRQGSGEYSVVDTNVAPNLHLPLHNGDTFFVANMAA